MSTAATLNEERTFESAVPLTPEQAEFSKAYFEQKGMQVEISSDDATQPPPKAEPPAAGAPKEPPVDASAPAADLPEGVDPVQDAEAVAEWQSAKNDGEKLGRQAKKTRLIKEQQARIDERDREIAELKGKLEAAVAPKPDPQTTPLAAPEAPKPQAAKPEEPAEFKPQEFAKPRPKLPAYNDFLDQDDPVAAHADAVAKYTEEVSDWKDEKREHDSEQKRLSVEHASQRQTETAAVDDRKKLIDSKFAEAQAAFTDFNEAVNKVAYTPVLKYALIEQLPDGLILGYHLAKPEHAAVLKELTDKTKDVTADQLEKALIEVGGILGVFRRDLKRAAEQAEATGKTVDPPPPDAAPPTTPKQPAPQTPSAVVPPVKEAPSITPVRGRGAVAELRPEDVDPMDSDKRRELRRQRGEW